MGLDTVELVMAFEEEFGVTIPDADAQTMETPRAVIDYLGRRLAEEGRSCERHVIAEKVREITLAQLGLHPKHYREDATFVGDFGAD